MSWCEGVHLPRDTFRDSVFVDYELLGSRSSKPNVHAEPRVERIVSARSGHLGRHANYTTSGGLENMVNTGECILHIIVVGRRHRSL